jgi:serine/threonine-protein kinase
MSLREELQNELGASYTIDRELGGGGMSRVFLADDVKLKRRVVVKVLPPEFMEGLSAERFAREIRVAASLQQANIVRCSTTGEAMGLPYFTMPYVDGESLRGKLATSGRLPIAEVMSILRDVVRALSYAHCAWFRASRHQAGQRPAVARDGDGDRLRNRQGNRGGEAR